MGDKYRYSEAGHSRDYYNDRSGSRYKDYDRDRKRKKSRRSRSRSDSSEDSRRHKRRHKSSRDRSPSIEDDSNFSYLDHKAFFNKILQGHHPGERLVDDFNDFWLFLNKYESLLKRSGQTVIPKDDGNEEKQTDEIFQSTYNKTFSISLSLKLSKSINLATLSGNERKIDERKLKGFLMIVTHYLDFKQKERFQKLMKLRKFQENLPIAAYRDQIVSALQNEQILILAGDTGCGKSTQVPQYLYRAGYDKIACTQPRRLACISLSKRVAHEMLAEYKSEVGYQIRFERSKTVDTRIIFITEGLLLRQLADDDNLANYSVIILDEVHERNLNGDFLIGITKCLLRARPDVKIILMSATINLKLFTDFFSEEQAAVIEVPGRLFPIKLHYMPHLISPSALSSEKKTRAERLNPEPYIQIMGMIDKKYPPTEKGDLLIFLSGLNEITSVVDAAKEYNESHNKNWIILPLHSSLSMTDQDKVFDYSPEGMRKCVISTNIAETSLTIDGIRFVIDSGKVKEMTYDPNSKMQRLKELWISQASAEQRKGRAGRTGPGICYRLYSEKDYDTLASHTKAEIHKVPLESLLLQMVSMGLPNARLFPFIEPPEMESIENAILTLKQLEAMSADEKLTSMGKALSKIPVEVTIGKMLLVGSVFRQLQPILAMAASLNVQSPFTNRAHRDQECEKLRKELESDHGDPIILLNLYREWLVIKQSASERSYEYRENSKKWCRNRGLEEQRFYEITKLKSQLESLLQETNIIESSANSEKLSASERSIRHGEQKYLKQLRRAHKMEAPRQRKLLKAERYGFEQDDEVDDGRIDIRDVEFRLSNDFRKLQNLVLGASAESHEDLTILKLILVSGLYPNVAVSDEFNHLKSASEQFFHTKNKPYTSLHPMSYFSQNYGILNVTEGNIVQKPGIYKSKSILSSKHQLLVYLNILETTKAYLMNTMRMPAAQTLLLFAQEIDTNLTFSRIVCDSWLCCDFPHPESGQVLLSKAISLRQRWNKLLNQKLNENETERVSSGLEFEDLERDLVRYMNSEVFYTIKRLLPADLKSLYKPAESEDFSQLILDPNPFSDEFVCLLNSVKGGIFLTENVTYGCIDETDWSMQMAEEIYSNEWECPHCKTISNMTNIQKLQHSKVCKPIEPEVPKALKSAPVPSKQVGNFKEFKCEVCFQVFQFTNVEILKHKKSCKIKEEK